MGELINSIVSGLITGTFTAGAVWGVLETKLKWLRRDVDEIRNHLWGTK